MSNASARSKGSSPDAVIRAIENLREELVETSLDIPAHPELNYQEHHAAALLADSLERHGFQVERGIGGVETAFSGTIIGGGGDAPRWRFWPSTTLCPTSATAAATTSSPSLIWEPVWEQRPRWIPCRAGWW